MNKKSITVSLEFLFWFVSGIVIFGVFIGCTTKYLSLNPDSEKSYREFIEKVEKVVNEQKIKVETTTLRMKKETAVVGFAKNVDELKFTYLSSGVPLNLAMKKPNKCEKDKTCICLCKKTEHEHPGIDVEYTCTEFECSNFDFELAETSKQCTDKKNDDCISKVEGGFIFARGFSFQTDPDKESLRAVYIEKDKNKIGICENRPCLEST